MLEPNIVFTLTVRADVSKFMGDYKGAMADIDAAMKIEMGGDQVKEILYRVRGDIRRLAGDYHGALEDLNTAFKFYVTSTTLSIRADVKRLVGDSQGALEDLNAADELELNSFFILLQRGTFKALIGDIKGSTQDLDAVRALMNKNRLVYEKLASERQLLGDTTTAQTYLTRALVLKKKMEKIHKIDMDPRSTYDMSPATLNPSSLPMRSVIKTKLLGKGAFGAVWLGKWFNTTVALKEFVVREYQANEILLLSQSRHQNVVRVFGVFNDANSRMLVMEYLDLGSLDKFLEDHEYDLESNQLLWM